MKTQLGVWIDHQRAVIVALLNSHVELRTVDSNLSKRVKAQAKNSYAPVGESDIMPDDERDRAFNRHLTTYYDRVVAAMGSADEIYLMGPGEAKYEMRRSIEKLGLAPRLADVESADSMTNRQVIARVKEFFNRVPARNY